MKTKTPKTLPGFNLPEEAERFYADQGGALTQLNSDEFTGYVVRLPAQRLIHFYVYDGTGPVGRWAWVHKSTGHYDEHSRFWNPAAHRRAGR